MSQKRTAKLTKDYIAEEIVKTAVNESYLIDTEIKEDKTEEFYKQLEDFKKDNSVIDKFSSFKLINKIGVDVFMYRPNRKMKTALFISGAQGTMQIQDVKESTNIAKVVLLPIDYVGNLTVGDTVYLSVAKTVGEGFTPEYMMIYQNSQSNLEPILPDGLKVKCPKIVSYFYENALVEPHDYNKLSQDITTFAIDEFEIIGKYEY